MKQSDIASLIIIVVVSFSLAFIIGNAVFNTPESRSTQVEVVNSFETEIIQPTPGIFNENAINPTEDITISESDTDKPFEE